MLPRATTIIIIALIALSWSELQACAKPSQKKSAVGVDDLRKFMDAQDFEQVLEYDYLQNRPVDVRLVSAGRGRHDVKLCHRLLA